MTIAFNTIPAQIGVSGSYTEFNDACARTTGTGKPYVLMVYGQMDKAKTGAYPNGSTVPANMPVQVQSYSVAMQYFGSGSILAEMAKTLFKTNTQNQVWFNPQLDDAAGVKRVLTVDYATVYTAATTEAGIERLYVGESEYRIGVAIGGTGTTVAAAMAAVINADASSLFVATSAAAVLTLTAKNAGALANDVQAVAQYYAADRSAAGAFVNVVQATAGAQNPSIAAGIASAANMYMTHVVLPYTDAANYALILSDAQDRWGAVPGATSVGAGQQDYVVFSAYRGTETQFATFMAAGRNSQHVTTAAIEPPQVIGGVQYGGLMSAAWQYAAAYAGASALGTSVVANDPLQAIVLSCLKPAPRPCQFTWNERNRTILQSGGSTYTYNDANQVVLENGVTENLTTDAGAATDANRRVETQFANSYLRWSLNNMLQSKYPRSRLAGNGTTGLPNNVATPDSIAMSILAFSKSDWIAKGIIEDYAGFKSSLIVERSTTDCNTVNIFMKPKLVNVLVVKATQICYVVC